MTIKYFACVLIVGLTIGGTASALAKKKPKGHFTLLEAYHSTPQNDAQAPPMTGDHFVIKWNDEHYPETFFWRGGGGWLSCKIEKAHKSGMGNYVTADDQSVAHRGDTLMLSPVTGGRFPIPKEIPDNAKNTLFYKTGGSAWLSFPVKRITKR